MGDPSALDTVMRRWLRAAEEGAEEGVDFGAGEHDAEVAWVEGLGFVGGKAECL